MADPTTTTNPWQRASSRASSSTSTGLGRLVHGRNPSTGHTGRYTAVIAVEYIACMVMVLLSGGLAGKNGKKEDVLVTPAIVMVRLSAITLLFFALAIFSTGKNSGRIAAAFGALVATGVALNATAEWQSLANIFSGGGSSGGPPAAPAGGSSNAPTSIPAPGGGQAGDVGGQCPPGYRYDAQAQSCVINTSPVGGQYGPIV